MKTLEYLLLLAFTLTIVVGIVWVYIDLGASIIGRFNSPIIVYNDEESIMVLVDRGTPINEVIYKCLSLLSS